jgi:hypothetical protein
MTQILNDIRTKSVGIGSGINHSFSATLFIGIPQANFFMLIAVFGHQVFYINFLLSNISARKLIFSMR